MYARWHWWDDIPPVKAQGAERLGYPTQKPLALLERIISASSRPGDVVLNPQVSGVGGSCRTRVGWLTESPVDLDWARHQDRRAGGA